MALINVKGAVSAPSEIKCAGFRYLGSDNYEISLFSVTFDGTNYNIDEIFANIKCTATGPYVWTESGNGAFGFNNLDSSTTDKADITAGYGYIDAAGVSDNNTYLSTLSVAKSSLTAASKLGVMASNNLRILMPM